MRAQTIQVGAANENGDVESAHSHLRHYLADALQLRGSSDFVSVEAYTLWLEQTLRRRNERRRGKFAEELRERFSEARADSDYLQMLRLSLEHGMERMEELLGRLKGTPQLTLDRVRRELGEQDKWRDSGDDIEADLDPYDRLLSKEVAHG
jgi:hypothetical protein